MSDDERAKREKRAYGAAWLEFRIRQCIREAAMVAHIEKRSGLRDGFIVTAGQIFDAVADDLEREAKLRPEWPSEDIFTVAESIASAATAATATPATPGEREPSK